MQKKKIIIISVISFIILASIGTYIKTVHFGNPFGVMKAKRNFTKPELIRAIRLMIAAEYEAVQLYMQVAESTDNQLAKKVLIDIADEERVHAGEFLKLLIHLDPEEEKHYKEGYKEVQEMIEELEKKKK